MITEVQSIQQELDREIVKGIEKDDLVLQQRTKIVTLERQIDEFKAGRV